MGVTVTGATGLTLGINPDKSDIILGLHKVSEVAALQSLGNVSSAEVSALQQAYGNDIPALAVRMFGVAGIDTVMEQSGGVNQQITTAGTHTVTGTEVEIGSTTSTPLNSRIILKGATHAATVIDGDMGTVDFVAQSGDVNYYAAGGNTDFVSGKGNDTIHVLGGADTIYGADGRPTVTGDWNAPGSTADAARFNGGDVNLRVIDGVMVQDVSHSTISGYGDDDYFGEHNPACYTNTIDGGVSDSIYGNNNLVVDSVSDSTIRGDEALTVSGGSNDTISASYSTHLDDVNASTISVSVNGSLTFIDGSNGISDTVTGNHATIYGTAGLDLTANTKTTATYYASSGNETLDGGLSTGNLYAVGGSGNDTLIGGSGHDTLQAGTGDDLLMAGSAKTEFEFIKGKAGGNDIIQDFGKSAGNVVTLAGYDAKSSSIQAMLDNATISGGNTTVSLTDDTRITFVGVTDLKVQNFKS
ncbi:outer membrane protein [Komagataeibacter europaeus NBRC 3261]|uniref:Outer membrane protein n=1 Tax=Komagataeibacter europaeus NBRC 3261 TaxID=1234669 RepID=A0A0D6PYA8_KOMEU|nr:hypothetical protein [Komagataeibacter europaeus]GAN96179.1 outer membrane protein [Komagataeibacter europaeus NBRC 3261]